MTTDPAKSSASQSTGALSGVVDFSKWEGLNPRIVDNEDAMGAAEVSKAWDRMYGFIGLKSPTEAERKSVRCAVYVYLALNGTSREGNYSQMIVTSTGHKFSASVIPRAANKMDIRRFARGNMEESYSYLKDSGVMTLYPRFLMKASNMGIGPNEAFATADWFTDCHMFTPREGLAHSKSFTVGIDKARRNRGGQSLEEVEDKRLGAIVGVNGPESAPRTVNEASW